MTLYKQGDERWARKIVGFGNKTQTFKNVGCTICDITYLYNFITGKNFTPEDINGKLLALGEYSKNNDRGAFIGASVVWKNIEKALPELKFVYRDYNYSNLTVFRWLNVWPRLPVLVEVYKGESVTKRHWVTYIGGQQMYDPITGSIISTSTKGYTPATGSARYTRA